MDPQRTLIAVELVLYAKTFSGGAPGANRKTRTVVVRKAQNMRG